LQAADRAAADGRGSPEAIQAQYDAARDLQQALVRARPVSTGCEALLQAAQEYARGQVQEAVGFDRQSASIASGGQAISGRATAALRRLPPGCTSGKLARTPQAHELLEPRPGEVFFGTIRSRAPARATDVEVRVDGRRWAVVAVRGSNVSFPLRTAPGRHDIELRFLAGDRVLATAGSDDVWLLPSSAERLPPSPLDLDRDLAARLAALANSFPGQAGIWVTNLSTGASAGWNYDARFPAASTVKLAVLVAALAKFGPRPERSPVDHDLEALTAWSSNLAANRLLRELGGSEQAGSQIAQATLRRLGATSSSYTGDYRVGTSTTRPNESAPDPPPLVSQRVTTAHDLARILSILHAAALGQPAALRAAGLSEHEARVGLALLLNSQPTGDNRGLFRPSLSKSIPIAQKNGWLEDARHTAAIIYAPDGPHIVVVLTYRPGESQTQAATFGKAVLRQALAR
jgi:beta-lactamase class A